MNFNGNLDIVKLHLEDMEQRASHHRLVKSVKQHQKRESALLVTVGRQMVAMGRKLEAMGVGQSDEIATEIVTLQPETR